MWAGGERLTPEKIYSATALFYLLEMDRMWRFVENAENLADFFVSCRRFGAFLLLPEVASAAAIASEALTKAKAAGPADDDEREGARVLGAAPVSIAADAEAPLGGSGAGAMPLAPGIAVLIEDLVATVGLDANAAAGARPVADDDAAAEVVAVAVAGGGGASTVTEVLRLSLSVRVGELCAVVGRTGAGKSCLLLALLGELPVARGRVRVAGAVSYAPQQPFVMSGTVRDNVCFGETCDEARLARVLASCQLGREVTPDTVVGERGVTLSGGQRARLGLARCAYRRAAVYLLDDPLSALDAEVGRRVFEDCVRGLLLAEAGAAVVLVTHQLRFLRAASSVVVLGGGGRLVAEGDFGSLSAQIASGGVAAGAVGAALGDLLQLWEKEEKEEKEEAEEAAAAATAAGDARAPTAVIAAAPPAAPSPAASPAASASASASAAAAALAAADDGRERAFREDGGEGAVSLSVFAAYLRFWAGAEKGWHDSAHILVVLVAAAVAFPAVGGFLGAWASLPFEAQQRQAPAAWYAALLVAAAALAVYRPVAFARRTVIAGRALHDLVFRAVLTAPTAFFDARPAGSVLARFAKDVQVLDERLPLVACDVILQVGRALGVLVLVCASNPLVLLAVPPLLLAFFRIRAHFVLSSRALKRLESASRPPVLSILTESLGGLPVIRAFGAGARVDAQFKAAIDANSRPWTAFFFATRWLALRLDMLCVLFLTLASAAAVVARGLGIAPPSDAAIGLSFITMVCARASRRVRARTTRP
jgi:ATP-binding cassette subfamily C (CFTR/MRP) protein 4